MKDKIAGIIKEALTGKTSEGKVYCWPTEESCQKLADKIIDSLAQEGYGKLIDCPKHSEEFMNGCKFRCDNTNPCRNGKVFEAIKSEQ